MNRLFSFLHIHLFFVNDIQDVEEREVISKITNNTEFSFSYVALLIASTIVCTLGLLLNSAPIVIGGMLISPLMWPLMKISVGVSFERRSFINQAVSLLILSIGISLISSYAITSVSPIKSVSTEILVRTNPTLLDVFIAIAAGAIAAIAIVEKKVSDSLAGVAIATSLMPPLCVSGIGLALSRYAIANGAFLLFCTNVVSIIFVSVLVFSFAGIRRESENGLRRTGIALISIVLIFTSIPLFILLKNYSFESQAYRVSQEILTNYLRSVSPEIYVENVSTSQVETEKVTVIRIEADVLIPEDVLIDYQQKTAIIQNLQSALGRDIELNLRVQKTISLVSQEDQHTSEVKKTLSDTFMNQIYQINSTMTLDSLNIFPKSSKDGWSVEAILRADPQNQLTENERGVLEKLLSDKIGEPVSLSIELISRVKLKSLPDIEQETIKTTIREYFGAISRDIDIAELTLSTEPLPGILKNVQSPIKPSILITLDMRIPEDTELADDIFFDLKNYLVSQYKRGFTLKVNTITKKSGVYL